MKAYRNGGQRGEPGSSRAGDSRAYRTGPQREQALDRLVEQHCGIRRVLGRSHLGREIVGYEWVVGGRSGDTALADNRPALLLLSLLHPLEWIGFELHVELLARWLDSASPLPVGTRISSVPIANADGLAALERERGTRRGGWARGNARGVDLNRNFPVDHHARPRGLDWWPVHRPGRSPLSEPETRAIAEWIRGRRFALALSLHSFGEWIFSPPAGRWSPGPTTSRHRELARSALSAGQAAHHAANDPAAASRLRRYREAQLGRWSPLFRAHGAEIDFLCEESGALSYLIEISPGGIGAWGLRGLGRPACWFNPPDPAPHLHALRPVLDHLALGALAASAQTNT